MSNIDDHYREKNNHLLVNKLKKFRKVEKKRQVTGEKVDLNTPQKKVRHKLK
jgi:hypothetical protein